MTTCVVDMMTGQVTYSGNETELRRMAMSVTVAQLRVALHRAGLLATANAAVAQNAEAAIAWDYCQTIARKSAVVAIIADATGRTDAQMDELFEAASVVTF